MPAKPLFYINVTQLHRNIILFKIFHRSINALQRYVMKFTFAFLFVLCISMTALGRSLPATDTVNICGRTLQIPDELKLIAPQQLSGVDYSITWQYISKKELEKMPEKIINSLNKKLKNVSSLPLNSYFLFIRANKTYGFTYDGDTGSRAGEMIVFAVVNNQPVYVQIKLNTVAFENEQLPLFINRLLVLVK